MFGQNAPFLVRETLGGWQLTAIHSASSGLPINISYSPNSNQQVSPLLTQRPNQIPGVPVLIPKSQRVRNGANTQFAAINVAAFKVPDGNQPYGNVQRNSVRFDSFYQLDLGLHKNFALYPEGTSFEFRAEAFNVLNQTNYAFASSNISSGVGGFGIVNAQSTFPARILQLAGKIIF
jgi:hypothetical protein